MKKKIKQIILAVYFLLRLPAVVLIRVLSILQCGPSVRTGGVGKILIIRLDRIGDFVASLPVMDNLKLFYKDAQLHVLVMPYIKGLAGRVGSIDSVLEYRGFLRAVSDIRRNRYDLVIDLLLDYKLKTAILAALSCAPVRFGFGWGYRELLFNRVAGASDLRERSMVAAHLEALNVLGVPVKVNVPRIESAGPERNGRLAFGIHPGGHYPSQCWDKEKFADLAGRLLNRYDCSICVFAGPNEKDIVSYIVTAAANDNIRAVFPDTGELVGLIAGFDVLICNNSGPLHIAAAESVATVSTMGPTDPVLWWPQGGNNIVIRKNLDCSPCGRPFCQSHECMDSIDVEEVENAVIRQVNALKRKVS